MSLAPVADVAVFDFDHTICRFDSSAHFFFWLIRQQWWRVLACISIAPLVLPLFFFRATQRQPVRIAVRLATVMRSIDQLPALVATYLRQSSPDWAYAQALERLRWHQQHGDHVVIATGSLEPLVQEMLRQAGLSQVQVVGSQMTASRFGWVSAKHCIGKNKIPMLSAQGINAPWRYAYSDHFADLPMLRGADTPFLINAKAKSLRIIRAKGLSKLEILRWQ